MPHYRKLTGKLCYLSPIAPEDAPAFTAWLNDLSVTVPLGDEAYVPLALQRMESEIDDAIRRQEHIFSIIDCASDQLIGRCLLFGVDLVNRSAMLGIFIGDKSFWGRGYGQEAARLLLHYTFNLLNLHSVMLGVFSFNERAQAAYRKLGFREIGRRRDARIIAGKAYDGVLMDMLEDEFRARWGNTVEGLEQT